LEDPVSDDRRVPGRYRCQRTLAHLEIGALECATGEVDKSRREITAANAHATLLERQKEGSSATPDFVHGGARGKGQFVAPLSYVLGPGIGIGEGERRIETVCTDEVVQ
jgi:hypothetical protein